jgi:hypothetical protein
MSSRTHRVLAVTDWSVDAARVVDALRSRNRHRPEVFGLVVPSRLGALDWIGDPNAARPCAERQLDRLSRLTALGGVPVDIARVGAPETTAAVDDVLEDWAADEIVVFERARWPGLPGPLGLVRRLERRTGVSVERVAVTSADGRKGRRLLGPGTPHCTAQAA